MDISAQQRLEIIKIEMGLLQATLDKYDDLIFRNRNGFSQGMMRHQYWYKYVLKYRTLRESFNREETQLIDLSLYDLTNHFMQEQGTASERLRKSFFKLEPGIVYGLMALCSFCVWLLIHYGIITFVVES